MKVSVIIPAYNAAVTLRDAIGSVLGQATPDWEAIIVNDGSTDATAAIASELAQHDSRIRMISQENCGESAARNAGIAAARYDWLLFLDADDWIDRSHLQRLTAALAGDPALDAVHCGWVRVAMDGTHIRDDYRPPMGDLFPVLARRAAFPVHACLVRRSIVEAVGRFDVSLRKSPDWDLWQRVARTGAKFGSVPDVLAYYRMSSNSASMEAEQMLVDDLTVLRRGHANDPRVPNPAPEYANGLPGSSVESQEFYLLCWCAGLLLGSGEDARPLLRFAGQDKYPGLYANAVAQCIFDAAPLPSCRPPQAWIDLWPGIQDATTSFLAALENQSQTADLAGLAITQLKKLILKNSPKWNDVIEQHEKVAAQLQNTVDRFAEGFAGLDSDRDHWRRRAEELEPQIATASGELREASNTIAELERQVARLSGELREASNTIAELEPQIAALHSCIQQGEELERQVASLSGELREASNTIADLEQRSVSMDLVSNEIRARAAELEAERAHLKDELEKWRHSARHRGLLIEEIHHHGWVRLGLRLGAIKRRDIVPASLERPHPPSANWAGSAAGPGAGPKWELKVAEGSEAHAIYPDEDHEMVKVGITRARTKADWDIQLNRAGLSVSAGVRYAVMFCARAARPREIAVGVARAHSPWSSLGLYARVRLAPEWSIFQEEFVALADDDNARIHFDLGARGIAVDLTSVALEIAGGRGEGQGPAAAGIPGSDGRIA